MIKRKVIKVSKLTPANKAATMSYLDDLLRILTKEELSDQDNIDNMLEAYDKWLVTEAKEYANARQANSAIKLQLVVS